MLAVMWKCEKKQMMSLNISGVFVPAVHQVNRQFERQQHFSHQLIIKLLSCRKTKCSLSIATFHEGIQAKAGGLA